MQKSRNGQWIIDDLQHKYIISNNSLSFLKIIRYQYGFNVIDLICKDENYNETEINIPRNIFNTVTFPTFVEAMVAILKKNNTEYVFFDQNNKQRLFEYTAYLIKYYPEKLI
jgi:hypothetical protein